MSWHLLFNCKSSTILFSLILFTNLNLIISAKKKPAPSGPQINITKHISFPNNMINTTSPNQIFDITLLGSATISNDDQTAAAKTTTCIHIPEKSSLQHSAGRAIYSSPIRLFDPITRSPASFQTTFSFRFQNLQMMSTSSTNNNNNNNNNYNVSSNDSSSSSSGGLSFVIVPDELTVGRPGPWLAMMNDACEDEYKSVAVEFDTRMNAEFGDPNDNHVGINLGSIVSSVVVNVSDFGIRLNDGSVHRAWITYDGDSKFLEIYLARDSAASTIIPAVALYSGNLDLSPYLNEYMFVGFSGSTGSLNTQVHSICSWNFSSVSRAFLRLPSDKTCESKIIVVLENDRIPSKAPSSFFIFLAVVVLVIIVMINLYFNGKRRKNMDDGSTSHDDDHIINAKEMHLPSPPNRARKFSLIEISWATRGFGELQILGNDAGKSVTYKGTFSNGYNVAVKRFSSSSSDNRRRMCKGIQDIAKIRHPNLVPIRGWCFERQETIVIYDFVPNGSLDKWMFGFGVLPWIRRFKIVKEVGEALSYLHAKDLAHKNVKTSSVFLDVSFRAVVGDFGFVSTESSHQFESLVSKKVDVFEFGILILEVVSGRVRKSSHPGELNLLDLAWAMHESNEKAKLVDRRMGQVVNPEQAIRVLEVGLLCTLNDNKGRPNMDEVVEYLNFERPIPDLPLNRPVSLFPYSSTSGLCTGYYSCASFKI